MWRAADMLAQHSYAIAMRPLAAFALALAFVLIAGGAVQSARADGSQWMRSQPHWSGQSNGWNSNGWQRSSWKRDGWNRDGWGKRRHHHRHFHASRPPVIIGGPGIVVINPGFARPGFGHPGFVVGRPSFANPAFVV